MTIHIKYLFDGEGKIEAAVIPIQEWNILKEQLHVVTNEPKASFNPAEFQRMLKDYNLHIEEERQKDKWSENL